MRILKRIALGLVGIVLGGLVVLYAGSEWKMRRSHDVPIVMAAIPHDAGSIAEGGRLAKITGCRDCHGANGGGQVLVKNPMLGTIAAPALARVTAAYSDAELVRAIRHGVRRDGSGLYIMPTDAHTFLSDEDVTRIVAWIRTLRPRPDDSLATTSAGPMARALILAGKFPSSVYPATVSSPKRSADTGRYFVNVICAACHALHEPKPAHDGKGMAPALAPMGAAYDPAAFRTLLRTGVGPSRRDLGLMKIVSVKALQALSDEEIAAIQAYLTAEAANAPAS